MLNFVNASHFNIKIPLTYNQLSHEIHQNFITPSQLSLNSLKIYLQLINDANNQSNGEASDECLLEIFRNRCKLSEKCIKFEDPEPTALGYQQTHK